MALYKGGSLKLPSALHILSPAAVTCNTSPFCRSARDSRDRRGRHSPDTRQYATVAGSGRHSEGHHETSQHDWPETPRGQTCPTPYQIFSISKTEKYSKAKFYELVKLYHPDKESHGEVSSTKASHECLPRATRLERYRLIVAAHTLLSDPAKRSAYDRWGAGWAGKAETGLDWNHQNRGPGQAGPFTTSWRDHADPNIWSNATWEDWERWREKQDANDGQTYGRQNPLFASNSTFVSLVIVLAAIGGSWNLNRAENEGGRFLAARDAVHDQTSKDLRKVRQLTSHRPKDERIDWFVRNREASFLSIGAEEIREDKVRHILPRQETCLSEETRSEDNE